MLSKSIYNCYNSCYSTINIIIFFIFIIGLVTSYKDSSRVRVGLEPQFVIKKISYHGDKVTYWGLGYKVIRYVNVSPNEPFESNRGVKYGSWFMKYELPTDSEYNGDINNLDDFYNTELTKNRDIRNLGEEYNSFDAQKDNCKGKKIL